MNKLLILILIVISNNIYAEKITNDIYINSQNIKHDKETNIVILGKNSLINYQTTSIKTDEGIIDLNTKTIIVDGNFYLNYAGDIMKGNLLKADLNFEEGSAQNVNYIFDKSLKINSKYINKKSNKIIFKNSFFTSCKLDGFFDCPTWSLKVKKTKYDIEEDFFEHFGTFIQILDNKVFYMPYFSHYGKKADRKKGFLTPTIEFKNKNLGGNITIPYYYPISVNSDVKTTPTFYYQNNISKYFENKLVYNHKFSEGNLTLKIDNYYDKINEDNINKQISFGANGSFNLNQNNNIYINLNHTSNISKYKSKNDSKNSILNSDINLNTFNLFGQNDLLVTKISGSKSLNNNLNTSNPFELPSTRYINYFNFKNNFVLNNEIKLDLITRNTSKEDLPMRILRVNVKNDLQKNIIFRKNYKLINKVKLDNFIATVEEGNKDTNLVSGKTHNFSTYISSEFNKVNYLNNKTKLKPRIKLILADNFKNDKITFNDNSKALSFNYNNIFQENRFFGSDNKELGSRIVMALEQKHYLNDKSNIDINYGRVYNFKKDTNLLKSINQKNNVSDHLTEINIKLDKFKINYNSRHDESNFRLKEDIFELEYSNNKNRYSLNKNLTNKESYINSESTHFMTLKYNRDINKSSKFSYESEINLKGKEKIYSQEYKLEFYDLCTNLSVIYATDNYNDGKELKPNETFSIRYEMNF